MSQAVLEKLLEKFGEEVILETHDHRGDDTASVRPDAIRDVCVFLKEDPDCAFEMIMDVTGVDWPEETPRLEVVYHLYSLTKRHRVRLKARVPVEDPKLPSVTPVWTGASWFEREAYDMYGVIFDGHPDLRRILLYPEFVGYPLRKDYPLNGEQPLTELRDPETQRPVMPGYSADLVHIGASSRKPEPPEESNDG